jgi:hypothetical protein
MERDESDTESAGLNSVRKGQRVGNTPRGEVLWTTRERVLSWPFGKKPVDGQEIDFDFIYTQGIKYRRGMSTARRGITEWCRTLTGRGRRDWRRRRMAILRR